MQSTLVKHDFFIGDPKEFQEHEQSYLEKFQPQTGAERFLVKDLIDCTWRLRLIDKILTTLRPTGNRKAIRVALRCATTFQRLEKAWLKELTALQSARRKLRNEPGKPQAKSARQPNHPGIDYSYQA